MRKGVLTRAVAAFLVASIGAFLLPGCGSDENDEATRSNVFVSATSMAEYLRQAGADTTDGNSNDGAFCESSSNSGVGAWNCRTIIGNETFGLTVSDSGEVETDDSGPSGIDGCCVEVVQLPTGAGADFRPTDATDLRGRSFVGYSARGHDLEPATEVILSFSNTKYEIVAPNPRKVNYPSLALNAGCNSMSAPYKVEDGRLRWFVDRLASTAIGCPGPAQAQDVWFRSTLNDGVDVAVSDDLLRISNSEGFSMILRADQSRQNPQG